MALKRRCNGGQSRPERQFSWFTSMSGTGRSVAYNLSTFPNRSMNVTLKAIIEFRDEMREFRDATRKTRTEHSHRLNVIDAGTASLKADIGILLTSVPMLNARLDDLEARVAALEARN